MIKLTGEFRHLAGIHGRVAKAAGLELCQVRCKTCGNSQTVKGADCLRRGWPRCHGETMQLIPKEPR